jgi:spore coat protein U-like protein
MKKLLLAALVWAAAIQGAFAQSPQSDQFDVNITLTSACSLSTVSDVAFTYTSFQAGAAAPTGGTGAFSVTCTQSFPYTLGLQAGTAAPSGAGALSIGPITDAAVNLDYTLSLASTAGTGSGAAQNLSIGGTIAGGQSGTCAGASCTNASAANKTHTLILTY